MFERTNPKTLMKWLIVAALLYFILPYDLLPDFLGFAGRVDDLLVMAWLAWTYRAQIRNYFETRFREPSSERASRARDSQDDSSRSDPPTAFDRLDPFEILGIARSASSDAIRAAYRARMMEYHPDKVAHLGVELQKLAHKKAQQIERAYRQLRD